MSDAIKWPRVSAAWLQSPAISKVFAAIAKDKDVPESQRGRARQLAGLLGADAIDDTAKAAGGGQP